MGEKCNRGVSVTCKHRVNFLVVLDHLNIGITLRCHNKDELYQYVPKSMAGEL